MSCQNAAGMAMGAGQPTVKSLKSERDLALRGLEEGLIPVLLLYLLYRWKNSVGREIIHPVVTQRQSMDLSLRLSVTPLKQSPSDSPTCSFLPPRSFHEAEYPE